MNLFYCVIFLNISNLSRLFGLGIEQGFSFYNLVNYINTLTLECNFPIFGSTAYK